MPLTEILAAPALARTQWSVEVRRVEDGVALRADHRRLLRTASVAKLLLLLEVAESAAAGSLDLSATVRRDSVPPVGDSGLWQHLSAPALTIADAAMLVGAVSDNLATNVLLAAVGLERVQRRGRDLFGPGTTLLDAVRDVREPHHPETLSVGTAADWCEFFARLARGRLASPAAAALLRTWLGHGADLSMVAAALHLDPLSHGGAAAARPLLWNKTGTDDGVRADVGVVRGAASDVAFAVICNWDPGDGVDVGAVLAAMRGIGAIVKRLADGHPAPDAPA